MKVLHLLRTISFVLTLLTTIPLFINYLNHTAPAHPLIVHLHVWFGLAFFIFAVLSMIIMKKNKNQRKG